MGSGIEDWKRWVVRWRVGKVGQWGGKVEGWVVGWRVGRVGDRQWDRQGLRDVILGNISQDRMESGRGLGSGALQRAERILSGVVTWRVQERQ